MSEEKTLKENNTEETTQPSANEAGSGLFYSVPEEQAPEEPAFGELIFGETVSGKRVDVKLKADRRSAKKQEPEFDEYGYPEGEEEAYYEDEFAEGEYYEDEYAEGEYAEGEYAEGEYAEGEYAEGEYYEDEYYEDEYCEDEYYEDGAEAEIAAEKEARRKENRAKKKAALKKELEEQLQKEKEAQRELEDQLKKEQEKLAEKARKEKEKQEAKAKRDKERAEAKARREEIKKTAEYRRMAKIRRTILSIVIAVVVIVAGIILIDRFVKLSKYSVISSIEMTNVDENSQIFKYHDGYVKIAGDGVTYFDKNRIIWNENLSMADPICDVCGDYIVVSDMKSTEIYVYGTSGFLDKFSLSHVVTDVEVSKYGSVAAVTNDGDSGYIELKDLEGNDIATVKTVFSSTGYLTDISMTEDGKKVAAAYILVADGAIESKVIFYDFSRDSNKGEKVVVGEFDQYKDTLVTTVEYMAGNKLAAIGDNAMTIYSGGDNPSILYENLEYSHQINSLFFSDNYIGCITENEEGDDAYMIRVYNLSGKEICTKAFNFAYNHADFAGDAVVLYSDYDCDVFNFTGTHKFSYTFDNRIFTLKSCGGTFDYVLLAQGTTQFIRLK